MGSRPVKGQTDLNDEMSDEVTKLRAENNILRKQLEKVDSKSVEKLNHENETLKKQNQELHKEIESLKTIDVNHLKVNDGFLRVDQWVSEQSIDSGRSSGRFLSDTSHELSTTDVEKISLNDANEKCTPAICIKSITDNRGVDGRRSTTPNVGRSTTPTVDIPNRSVSFESDNVSANKKRKEKRKIHSLAFRQMSDIDAYGKGLPLPDSKLDLKKKHSRERKERNKLRREYSIDKHEDDTGDDSNNNHDNSSENANTLKKHVDLDAEYQSDSGCESGNKKDHIAI
ncbi:uncharacterized protein [Amphiura filiformis]|uniref:uncharacterized protein n=1 Tax=Amphiura filiformis TaxID=82378 RepID=UPI003B2207BD